MYRELKKDIRINNIVIPKDKITLFDEVIRLDLNHPVYTIKVEVMDALHFTARLEQGSKDTVEILDIRFDPWNIDKEEDRLYLLDLIKNLEKYYVDPSNQALKLAFLLQENIIRLMHDTEGLRSYITNNPRSITFEFVEELQDVLILIKCLEIPKEKDLTYVSNEELELYGIE